MDKKLSSPTITDGAQTHEILAALYLAAFHKETSASIETNDLLVIEVACLSDEKLINQGVNLVKNILVGLRLPNGSRPTISQLEEFHLANKGLFMQMCVSNEI